MDTDGDGAPSLEDVQAAHAKIFKAVDANKDGKVTLEEIQTIFRGRGPADGGDWQRPGNRVAEDCNGSASSGYGGT
jgi:hypothetical protein